MMLHPALFLVGDSTMKTGGGNGETGPWGWGSELGSFFDTNRLHIYNEGHGGRSSRSFIEEGLWTNVLERMRPGDFLLIQFGHNDSANSRNYPDRVSLSGSGEQQQETNSAATGNKVVLHTYGWYLRQYVRDAKTKGVLPVICSPVPRNTWSEGKIKRGFDGYAQWAAESARASDAMFLDLNAIAARHYNEIGEEKVASYFADRQHTTKAGAHLNAKCVIEGLKGLKNCPLSNDLLPAQELGH
jgi:lysophospholipase L1-like esterase